MKGFKLRVLVSMKKTLLALLCVTPLLVYVLCLVIGCATTNARDNEITHSEDPVEVVEIYNGITSVNLLGDFLVREVYCNGEAAYCQMAAIGTARGNSGVSKFLFNRVYLIEDTYFVFSTMYFAYVDQKWPIEDMESIIIKIEKNMIISESDALAIFQHTGYTTFKEYAEADEQYTIELALLVRQRLAEQEADWALGVENDWDGNSFGDKNSLVGPSTFKMKNLPDKLRGNFRIESPVKIAGKIDSETYIFHVGYESNYVELVVRGRNLENCGAKVIGGPPTFLRQRSFGYIIKKERYPTFRVDGETYGWVLRVLGTTTIITQAGFYREVPLYEFVGINSAAISSPYGGTFIDGSLYGIFWY
jgi:hypothetical protein